MEDKIILTKVSDSKRKTGTRENVAIYESDNGLTITFSYTNQGEVQGDAFVRSTNT